MWCSGGLYERFHIFFSCTYKHIAISIGACMGVSSPYGNFVFRNNLYFYIFEWRFFTFSKYFTVLFFPYHVISTGFPVNFNRFFCNNIRLNFIVTNVCFFIYTFPITYNPIFRADASSEKKYEKSTYAQKNYFDRFHCHTPCFCMRA